MVERRSPHHTHAQTMNFGATVVVAVVLVARAACDDLLPIALPQPQPSLPGVCEYYPDENSGARVLGYDCVCAFDREAHSGTLRGSGGPKAALLDIPASPRAWIDCTVKKSLLSPDWDDDTQVVLTVAPYDESEPSSVVFRGDGTKRIERSFGRDADIVGIGRPGVPARLHLETTLAAFAVRYNCSYSKCERWDGNGVTYAHVCDPDGFQSGDECVPDFAAPPTPAPPNSADQCKEFYEICERECDATGIDERYTVCGHACECLPLISPIALIVLILVLPALFLFALCGAAAWCVISRRRRRRQNS